MEDRYNLCFFHKYYIILWYLSSQKRNILISELDSCIKSSYLCAGKKKLKITPTNGSLVSVLYLMIVV